MENCDVKGQPSEAIAPERFRQSLRIRTQIEWNVPIQFNWTGAFNI